MMPTPTSPALPRKKLPIGIQTLREIREDAHYYVEQIKDRGYADKYRTRGEPIHLIGVEFSKTSRNVVGFEVETLSF